MSDFALRFALWVALAYALIQGVLIGYLIATVVHTGELSLPVLWLSLALTVAKLFTYSRSREGQK